ncbi:hypothetical protein [Fimbriiglobus ruber]|uniref:Uncharacterized protein n=1 Tax=Fimbriiglobus ruber TaxID=1908690 RepID=A0A225DQN5_9BACT|nr:hypothetical protein [Fimbriiglobus ruber]OWK38675.1 hypothetical protein FRUB_07795 [Fimbriiglobus ruber]
MTPPPPTSRPDTSADPSADCAAFELAVQRVFDGDAGFDTLATTHPTECPSCRALAASAAVFHAVLPGLTRQPSPPTGLAARIVTAALRDRRKRRLQRMAGRVGALALAAAVLVAGAVFLFGGPTGGHPDVAQQLPQPNLPSPTPDSAPAPRAVASNAAPPPRVADQVAEAGSALAALTREATDRAIAPTRNLLPSTDTLALPESDVAVVEPAVESLSGVSEAARVGFEPMTNTTRRAVNLFLRDVGLNTPAKPNS